LNISVHGFQYSKNFGSSKQQQQQQQQQQQDQQ